MAHGSKFIILSHTLLTNGRGRPKEAPPSPRPRPAAHESRGAAGTGWARGAPSPRRAAPLGARARGARRGGRTSKAGSGAGISAAPAAAARPPGPAAGIRPRPGARLRPAPPRPGSAGRRGRGRDLGPGGFAGGRQGANYLSAGPGSQEFLLSLWKFRRRSPRGGPKFPQRESPERGYELSAETESAGGREPDRAAEPTRAGLQPSFAFSGSVPRECRGRLESGECGLPFGRCPFLHSFIHSFRESVLTAL